MAFLKDKNTGKSTGFCNPDDVASVQLQGDLSAVTVAFKSGSTINYNFTNDELAINYAHNLIEECRDLLCEKLPKVSG